MTYVTALTIFHTTLSLIAIVIGFVACVGLFGQGSKRVRDWFIATAIVTSATGYLFPFKGITPGQIVGVIALIILAAMLVAERRFRIAGIWRWIYAGGMVASLYLLVFVGIVQAFQKIAFLKTLAPTQSEPPFAIVQGATLLAFVVVGLLAIRAYRPLLPGLVRV